MRSRGTAPGWLGDSGRWGGGGQQHCLGREWGAADLSSECCESVEVLSPTDIVQRGNRVREHGALQGPGG